MRKIIFWFSLFVCVSTVTYFVVTSFGQSTDSRDIKLYYYNAAKDQDASGNVQCSRGGLVAVDRSIPFTQTPIQDSIKLLLEGKLLTSESADGVTTEYPLPGVQLTGASLSDGNLSLEFSDPNNITSGGSCGAAILWFQIEATAKQFPGVQSVTFTPDWLFQP